MTALEALILGVRLALGLGDKIAAVKKDADGAAIDKGLQRALVLDAELRRREAADPELQRLLAAQRRKDAVG